MSRINIYSLFSLATLSLGLTISASATTITITPGPVSTVPGATMTTFDSGSLPGNYTSTGLAVGVVPANTPGQSPAPGGDSTPFVYVGPGSSLVATFDSGINYLGFYWGSPDNYNTLTLTDSNGVSTVYGEGGLPVPGLVTDQITSEYVNLFDTGAAWTSVTWSSSAAAFEFDNIATTNATPEPASIALLGGGLLALGAGALRRRQKA